MIFLLSSRNNDAGLLNQFLSDGIAEDIRRNPDPILGEQATVGALVAHPRPVSIYYNKLTIKIIQRKIQKRSKIPNDINIYSMPYQMSILPNWNHLVMLSVG